MLNWLTFMILLLIVCFSGCSSGRTAHFEIDSLSSSTRLITKSTKLNQRSNFLLLSYSIRSVKINKIMWRIEHQTIWTVLMFNVHTNKRIFFAFRSKLYSKSRQVKQVLQINEPTNQLKVDETEYWMMTKRIAYNEQPLNEIMESRYSNSVRNAVKVRKRYHLYHITNDKNEAIFFILPIFFSLALQCIVKSE